jgi:hypothetical protein
MKKFCSGCQQLREESDGKKVLRGRITRWMCNICLEKKNVSLYQSKRKVSGKAANNDFLPKTDREISSCNRKKLAVIYTPTPKE